MEPIGGGGTSRSSLGLVFLTCAANGQCSADAISPAKKKLLFLFKRAIRQVFAVRLQNNIIYLVGSAPKAGSSWKGVMSIGAPLFQRPTIRAPRSSLPSAGVKTFPVPSLGIGCWFKKTLNSGTCWKSQRNTRKLPSTAQDALVAKAGSPVCPVRITPGSTG